MTLNLTAELERLITDLTATLPVYHSIDPARLLICVSSTRSGRVGGTYAKIHPLRFAKASVPPRFLSATTAQLRREHRILVAHRMPAPRLKVVTP